MHPAFSVIFLTTLIGMAQGLFGALIFNQTLIELGHISTIDSTFYTHGAMLSFVLLILGLFASFFHLGHPERAWRSAAMWRTSWLSREVIALPIFMGVVFVYALIHWFQLDQTMLELGLVLPFSFSLVVGFIGIIFSLTLFICTGMIYASVKFLQEWASSLTVFNFILYGLASGFTLATVVAYLHASERVDLLAIMAMLLTLLSAVVRIASLYRNARIKPISTAKTALGVRHNKINQIAMGAMGGSFNTREFMHGQSEGFVNNVKWFFLINVYVIPLVLLLLGVMSHIFILFVLALTLQYLGLLAERWFFFAQANHPQNIYYQTL